MNWRIYSPPSSTTPAANIWPTTRRRLSCGGEEMAVSSFASLHKKIVACNACPRLRDYCTAVACEKKRAYIDQTYWGKPVPGFGDPAAWLWIVGLAPGAH